MRTRSYYKLKVQGMIPFELPPSSSDAKGKGTKADPWLLKTPPGTSEFRAYRDETLTPPAPVVWVGKTELRYDLRAINNLHSALEARRLDAPRQRGRTEAGGRGNGRRLGAVAEESD